MLYDGLGYFVALTGTFPQSAVYSQLILNYPIFEQPQTWSTFSYFEAAVLLLEQLGVSSFFFPGHCREHYMWNV